MRSFPTHEDKLIADRFGSDNRVPYDTNSSFDAIHIDLIDPFVLSSQTINEEQLRGEVEAFLEQAAEQCQRSNLDIDRLR